MMPVVRSTCRMTLELNSLQTEDVGYQSRDTIMSPASPEYYARGIQHIARRISGEINGPGHDGARGCAAVPRDRAARGID